MRAVQPGVGLLAGFGPAGHDAGRLQEAFGEGGPVQQQGTAGRQAIGAVDVHHHVHALLAGLEEVRLGHTRRALA